MRARTVEILGLLLVPLAVLAALVGIRRRGSGRAGSPGGKGRPEINAEQANQLIEHFDLKGWNAGGQSLPTPGGEQKRATT